MKRVLILYASKSGTTKKAAETLARALAPDCDLCDLRKGTLITLSGTSIRKHFRSLDLSSYRAIALGSAMYMGRPLGAFMRFCKERSQSLLNQPLFLFSCGLATAEEETSYLWPLLPEALTRHTEKLYHLGGELRPDGGFMQRMVLNDYEKKSHAAPSLNMVVMEQLTQALRAE